MQDERTFNDLVAALTQSHPSYVQTDDGPQLVTNAGLLEQLREAVFGGMENTGGAAAFGSKPPIDAGALDLLEEITNQAADVLASVDSRPTPFGHAEHYVALWAAATNESTVYTVKARATNVNGGAYDELTKLSAHALVQRWVQRIDDFFNPPSTREINAECPQCHERYQWKRKDGTDVRSAALNFHRDKTTGETIEARCSLCGASWGPEMFERLARLIGAMKDSETVAELVERHADKKSLRSR